MLISGINSDISRGLTAYSVPDSIQSGDTGGLNLQTNYRYNYFTGLVERETNPDGVWTDYEYDQALRLKKVTSQIGVVAVTKFDQDSNGNDLLTYLSQTTYNDQGPQKVITSRQWSDGAGRVLRAGTGAGSAPDNYDMTATVYDGWGRVTKQSNPYSGDANGNPQAGVNLFWTVNTYDELSRVTGVTLPDTQFIQTDYYGATATSGITVIATDTVGRKRKVEADGFGRPVKVTEQNPANGNPEWETSYSYDVLDNLTQINQGGQLRTFTYDSESRLISETTPEAGPISYAYTDFDAVSTRRDARGVITTYTYGDLNLLTGVSYNNVTGVATTAPVSITYRNASPGKGKIEKVTDVAGSESYGYDNFGRLQSCTRVIDGIIYQKQYEYNEANQMTLMTYPSGKKVNVGRDDRGRLSAVKKVDAFGALLDTYLSGINYRVDGRISGQTLGDGTTESFAYSNDRLQLTSQTVMKGGNTLLSLSYGYEASAGQMGSGSTSGNSGQLVSVNGTINGQGRNQAFTYDNVRRLVTATGWSAWARKFDYDRYGNRTAVWDAVSGGSQLQNTVMEQVGGITTNRIASVNGTAFSYDASGSVAGDGARAYTYDAENRIVGVSGLSSESYGYDAKNHRVKKVVGGVVTHYIWEGDQVIAEYERGGGSAQATGTRYYHQDRLSTRIITDNAGAVVGTTDQLPFGEEIGVSGAGEKHKFTTYERDGALDYAVNRHYDPQRGRFNQVDPLGMGAASLADPQSLNLYAYCANDPVNHADPSGLAFTPELVSEGQFGSGTDNFARGGGGGIGFFIDGVQVSGDVALDFINSGLADYVQSGAGVYGNGSLIVTDLYEPGIDGGYQYAGQQAFFASSPQNPTPQQEQLQNPAPNLPRGTPQQYVRPFTDAFNAARMRLQNSRCAALFNIPLGELAIAETELGYSEAPNYGLDILEATSYRALPLGPPSRNSNGTYSVTGAATISIDNVFVNTQGPFFNIRQAVPGGGTLTFDLGTGLNQTEFAAFQLLHELGHQVGIFLPDAGDSELNRRNSQAVLDACFPELRGR
jgi:RHS repeat-associated protein